jgi:hypothetical protein
VDRASLDVRSCPAVMEKGMCLSMVAHAKRIVCVTYKPESMNDQTLQKISGRSPDTVRSIVIGHSKVDGYLRRQANDQKNDDHRVVECVAQSSSNEKMIQDKSERRSDGTRRMKHNQNLTCTGIIGEEFEESDTSCLRNMQEHSVKDAENRMSLSAFVPTFPFQSF